MSISDIVIAGVILMVLWYCRDVILIAAILLVGLAWSLIAGIFGK